MPLTISSLSTHDQQVLESIFNPLELTSIIEPLHINTDCSEPLADNDEHANYAPHVLKTSKQLEVAAVKLAEETKLEEALQMFLAALQLTPKRASIYNNRAQTLRLAGRDGAALEDLNRALELATEPTRTRCHALCQRGVLHRRQNNLDAARNDFEQAATIGSKFAKQQLVELNPFAALCNQMLRQAFQQLENRE